jgi:hypothetical protein
MVLGATLAIIGALGCAPMANDPFKDAGAAVEPEMTTASMVAYQGQSEFGRPYRRLWEPDQVYMETGVVTHWPLWWEDPFEDHGNRFHQVDDRDEVDVVFAWNWVDYMHMMYGPTRFIINTGGWPVSAVVTPPGTPMESDARIDAGGLGVYDHDAKRSDLTRREPIDECAVNKSTDPGPDGQAG